MKPTVALRPAAGPFRGRSLDSDRGLVYNGIATAGKSAAYGRDSANRAAGGKASAAAADWRPAKAREGVCAHRQQAPLEWIVR